MYDLMYKYDLLRESKLWTTLWMNKHHFDHLEWWNNRKKSVFSHFSRRPRLVRIWIKGFWPKPQYKWLLAAIPHIGIMPMLRWRSRWEHVLHVTLISCHEEAVASQLRFRGRLRCNRLPCASFKNWRYSECSNQDLRDAFKECWRLIWQFRAARTRT